MLGLLTLSSCAMPGVVSNPNNNYPQSVTETHTKTTLVAPPSYNMPYLPPSAIYQVPPQQQSFQGQYQASPVCPPTPSYQTMQYQDQCAPYGQAPANIRYNVVGSAVPAQPQYIVVHPSPASTSVQLQAVKPEICEENQK